VQDVLQIVRKEASAQFAVVIRHIGSRFRVDQSQGRRHIRGSGVFRQLTDVIPDRELTWGSSGAAYYVFELPWLNGRDLTPLTLDERRAVLDALALTPPLRRVAPLTDPKPWERACNEGWEGVIAKRRDYRYEHRLTG